MMNSPNMHVCLKIKKMYLNRAAITRLGNPTHLCFQYDEQDGVLYFAPASPDDLDAYEIPKFYWKWPRQRCEIAKIAFLRALQYRLGWEDGSKHYFDGTILTPDNIPTLAYNLTDGTKVR
jgi:hypothetical protein